MATHPIVLDMLYGLAQYVDDSDSDNENKHTKEYAILAYEMYAVAADRVFKGENQWDVLRDVIAELQQIEYNILYS